MIYLDTHTEALDIDRALMDVSPQRREAALRYVKASDRRQSLAAYLLLCRALKEEYGITEPPVFDFGPHGKPFLKDYPSIHFNLSHCPGAALCVIAPAPVGCDIEAVPSRLDWDVLIYYIQAVPDPYSDPEQEKLRRRQRAHDRRMES